jgi:phage shock protein C
MMKFLFGILMLILAAPIVVALLPLLVPAVILLLSVVIPALLLLLPFILVAKILALVLAPRAYAAPPPRERPYEPHGRDAWERPETPDARREREWQERFEADERREAFDQPRYERKTPMSETHTHQRHGLYRSRNGLIFGVCKGFADQLDINVFWLRLIAVIAFLMSGLWPAVGVYIIAALLMKPEPLRPFRDEADEEFYRSCTGSRSMAIHRLHRTFKGLERRVARMEGIVTARDYDWERRLNQ